MGLKIQYLGWASFYITTPEGLKVMTDPYLRGNPKVGIKPTPVDFLALDVDLIACSHPANDHFGQGVEILNNCPNAKVLGDHSTGIVAQAGGIAKDRWELTTAGAIYPIKDMKIKAFDACHIAIRTLDDGRVVTGEPLCYFMFTENCPTIFFGGDTSITSEMELWGKRCKPDIAILGIGGVDLNGRSLDEMDPEDAAYACKMLGVKKAIPMHYRGEDYLERFKRAIAIEAPECEVISLAYGESVEF